MEVPAEVITGQMTEDKRLLNAKAEVRHGYHLLQGPGNITEEGVEKYVRAPRRTGVQCVVLCFNCCCLSGYGYPSQQLQFCLWPQELQPEEILFPHAPTLSKLLRELI